MGYGFDQARSNARSSFHRFDFKAQGFDNVAVFADRIEPESGYQKGHDYGHNVIDALRVLNWCAQPIWRRGCLGMVGDDLMLRAGVTLFREPKADDVRRSSFHPHLYSDLSTTTSSNKENFHGLFSQAKRNFRCIISVAMSCSTRVFTANGKPSHQHVP